MLAEWPVEEAKSTSSRATWRPTKTQDGKTLTRKCMANAQGTQGCSSGARMREKTQGKQVVSLPAADMQQKTH